MTKDEDFVTLRLAKSEGPTVLWVRLGNSRRATLLDALGTILPAVIQSLENGELLIEIV